MIKRKLASQSMLNFIIAILIILLLYPLAVTFWCAFKSDLSYINSKWYPTFPLRIYNLNVAFKSIWRYLLNTVIVALVGTSGSLFISSLASFAFARMKFIGREFLYMAVIALMMMPGIISLVPAYMLYKSFNLLNTYLVLVLPVIVGGPIFGVFLLRSFFESIPNDLFESAYIDGAGMLRVFYSIAIPLCLPILGTLAIMQIIGVWNDYLWPLITIRDHNLLTISTGLILRFTRQYSSNMPVTFSGYMIASVPLILLFVFANKYYVEGLISTSIKL